MAADCKQAGWRVVPYPEDNSSMVLSLPQVSRSSTGVKEKNTDELLSLRDNSCCESATDSKATLVLLISIKKNTFMWS